MTTTKIMKMSISKFVVVNNKIYKPEKIKLQNKDKN